jgi:probable HAF family extracellular repeat protein
MRPPCREFLFILLALLPGISAKAAIYSVVDLGTLADGTTQSGATDINDRGQIVGLSVIGESYRAYIWHDGIMTEIANESGQYTSSWPAAINNLGQVVGSRAIGRQPASGFLWHNGTSIDLGRPPGNTSPIEPHSINDSGVVSGESDGPFIWNSGIIQDFRTYPGASVFVWTTGMNNRGSIAGNIISYAGSDSFEHGGVWTNGVVVDLGDLPGGTQNFVKDGNFSRASAVNDLGQAVGESDGANGYHAIFWSDGTMIDLGALPGLANRSTARDINNQGVVVGNSGDENVHAFVWDRISGMRDLNDLLDESGSGWLLTTANAINNHGQIVGAGFHNGQARGYLLTPIPEPSTLLAAAAALASAALVATARSLRRRGRLVSP